MSEPQHAGPGEEIVDGELYEYPFHVSDFHGNVIRRDLDNVPPFLNREEVDILSSELEHLLEGEEVGIYRRSILRDVLRKLPDSEHGRGNAPDLEGDDE